MVSIAGLVIGGPVPAAAVPLSLVAWVLVELTALAIARARDDRQLERRLFTAALALSVWAVAMMHFLGGVWLGPLAFALVLATFGSALNSRSIMVVTAFGALLFIGHVTLDGWGLLPHYGVAHTGLGELLPRAELIGLTAVTAGLVLPAFAMITHYSALRLRRLQLEALQTAEQLHEALFASEEDLQQNATLTAEVEHQREQLEARNHYLSVVNAVSFALSERGEGYDSFERALRLVARLLGMRLAQVDLLAHAAGPETRLVVTADPQNTTALPIPPKLVERVVSTRSPVFPDKAEGDAPTDANNDGCAVVPLVAKGVPIGTLGLRGDISGAWDESNRHLMLLVARELATAVENLHLYEDAVQRATRESLINDLSRELSGETAPAESVSRALRLVGEATGAQLLSVIVKREEADDPEVTTFVAIPDDEEIGAGHHGGDSSLTSEPRALTRSLEEALGEAATLVLGGTGRVVLGGPDEVPVPATLSAEGVEALVAVPLRIAPTVSGALVMAAGRDRLGARELQLVERLADTLGGQLASEALIGFQERRIRELSGLGEIAGMVQSTVDPDRLLSGFARALTGLTEYRRLYIVNIDHEAETTRVDRFGPDGRQETGRSLPHVAADLSHPWFRLRRVTTWSTSAAESPPSFVESEDQEAIVVPLRPKGELIGLAIIVTTGLPSGDLLALCEQAFGQLSLALDSASLYRQATERAARIQVLGNLARIVASAADLRGAFDAFAEEVRWLIPFDRACMMLVDEQAGTVDQYASYPDPNMLGSEAMPLAGSMVSAAAQAQAPIRMSRTDPEYRDLSWATLGDDATDVAAVPIFRGQECVALFGLVRTREDSYEFQDLVALQEVGQLLAVSIERVRLFEQAEHGARHDVLTGLPNYRYFTERVEQAGAEALQAGMALMAIDVDDLKLFNDSLGHAAGDRLIRLVARELRAACRTEDFVARTGGDEFVVMMEGDALEAALTLARRVHDALADAHLEIPDAPSQIRISIGVATAPEDGETVADLLDAADQAMYSAKFAGGNRTIVARETERQQVHGATRRRPNRVIGAVVRATTSGASEAERRALGLAERYVTALGPRVGLSSEVTASLGMFVAGEASSRLADRRRGFDRRLAERILRGLQSEWQELDPEGAGPGQQLIRAAVELAWLQAAAPVGANLTPELAVAALRGGSELPVPLLDALEEVARSEALERRSRERAA